ncbi:MAG: tetratricopeptide repeat protein [Acidobacteria bacterium]|nr:tetratricopeptide repeat protein [Acidobacteriota bacterium]
MLYRECQILRRRFAYPLFVLCLSFLIAACGHSTASFLAKGEEYLQKRKFHDALMQFRSAAESDSSSAKAHWGLARAYENLGQFNDTLEELRKTVELDAKNLDAKAKLGNYFLLVQPPMIAEAEKIRDEILAADPSFIEGHILTASILAAQGKSDTEVVGAINKAIALDTKRIESYVSLQRLYMTRDKAAEAEAAIKKGIAECPQAVTGYIEYGRFLMYSNRDGEAEQQFNKAIEIDGASIEARESIAEFYVTSRQMEKAEKAYVELVQIQENSPESRLVLAEFYAKAGREDESIATLNQILTDAPEYVRARYKLGQMYLDRKDSAKVTEQLDALLKINDDDLEALMLRSKLRIQEGKAQDAVKDLEEVLKKQPSGREPLFLMAQARLALGQIDQANAFLADLERYHPSFLKAGLIRIQAAFNAGDSSAALKLSNDLVQKTNTAVANSDFTPQMIQDVRVRAISSRGLANLELGRFAEAKNDLQEIVRISPKSASAMVNLAKVLIAERNDDGAIALFEKALSADPQNFDAVSGVVNIMIRQGQAAKAHAEVDRMVAANAGRADVLAALHYLKSTVFTAQKNAAETEKELAAAIELDPNYFPAYSAYASFLVGQGRADEAVAQYRMILEKRPAAPMFTLLGIIEDSRGNSAEAEKAYRRALEMAPDASIAANNLAWLIADKQGNLDEALQLATLAVSKGQSTPGFYDTLGWVYLQKGLASPAVEQFRKAVAIEESKKAGSAPTPGYRLRLGMALAKAGDKASARREVETSLRNGNQLSQRELRDAKSVLANL